jgi:hypothetical protein
MNEQLQKLIAMLQGQTNKMGQTAGAGISGLGQKIAEQGVKNVNPMLSKLGQAGVNAGNFVGSNPGMGLGGAALGGLNLAGLADGKDILLQLLAGAGGAGMGALAGGPTGALFGALGGGAVGDLVPKLGRMMQGNQYEKMISMYGENPSDQISSLMGDQDYMNNAWSTLGNKNAMSALSPEEEKILMEVLSRSTTRAPKNR